MEYSFQFEFEVIDNLRIRERQGILMPRMGYLTGVFLEGVS